MTAPKICEYCGACLDAGETCDCKESQEENAYLGLQNEEKFRELHMSPEYVELIEE